MSNSYQINFTDLVNKGSIQVDPNTVNNETSLKLPGRTKSDYGELVLENLLHLLENFANNNPPTNPIEGQLWYDTTIGVDQLKIYDGTQFVSASSIKKSNSRPPSTESNLGDLWVDTVNQQLYLYNGNDWTLVGPDIALDTIIDTTNTSRTVATMFINNSRLLIVSDVEFIPKTTIPGFDIIKAGVNIAAGSKYYGTAEAAENLIVPNEGLVISSNFARRDKDNTFIRPMRVQNNGGINIGETPTIQLAVAGNSNAVFRNLAAGGDIQFRLTEGILSTPVLIIKSDGKIGINKEPTNAALDVNGNIKASGNLSVEGTLNIEGNVLLGNNLTVEGNISAENLVVSDITPDQTGRNIGTNSLKFNNVFAQTVNADTFTGGVFNGIFNGTLNGAATSLTANTTFQLSGEVNSTNQIVYGGSGNIGGTQTFTTTINETFVTGKPLSLTIDKDDEILIVNNNVLRKVKQEVLVSTIPAIPIGMITPYGGTVPPTNWVFCDGSSVPTAIFNQLFLVIGWNFDPTLTNSANFRLPDLRGRFPIGNTAMGSNAAAADLGTVVDTGQLGAIGGSKETTISINNLPEHQHTLKVNNTQFYASTTLPASDIAPNTVDPTAPTDILGELTSSSVSQTGDILGITSEDPLPVVNPYQAVNYIIYAGATVQ